MEDGPSLVGLDKALSVKLEQRSLFLMTLWVSEFHISNPLIIPFLQMRVSKPCNLIQQPSFSLNHVPIFSFIYIYVPFFIFMYMNIYCTTLTNNLVFNSLIPFYQLLSVLGMVMESFVFLSSTTLLKVFVALFAIFMTWSPYIEDISKLSILRGCR